jgi:hypothetical protein
VSDCIIAKGGKPGRYGRGRIQVGPKAHYIVPTHVMAYIVAKGSVPPGMVVRHTCDNPPCINPEHLLIGTKADNAADMVERRRHWRHNQTHCKRGHPLTEDNIVKFSDGRTERRCLTCHRDRQFGTLK